MRAAGVACVLAVLAVATAGCLGHATAEAGAEADPQATDEPTRFDVTGSVVDDAFRPVAGAQVLLVDFDRTTSTAADGTFRFAELPAGTYSLRVAADGHEPADRTFRISPGMPTNLQIVLSRLPDTTPYHETWPFRGYIECAAEYLIITPSCDTILEFVGDEAGQDLSVTNDTSVFSFDAGTAWKTAVVDVSFDPSEHPGIAGMRASLYGAEASAEVLDYQRMHQGNAPGPFTLRIEAGTDYGDAVPVPDNATAFRVELYPHGHEPDESPLLGVGAAVRLEFEVHATVFYHEAAPDDWTLRSAA